MATKDKKTKKHYPTSPHERKHGKARKKQMAGLRDQKVPAASWLEQPPKDPFAGDDSLKNPAEFTAKRGGTRKKVRDLKRKQREERRADRKATRTAIRDLKKSSRKARKAKPFEDGAGPIVEMTRAERRADRKATRKASRTFRRQERKARRTERKADRQERRDLRTSLKKQKKDAMQTKVDSKLNTLKKKKEAPKPEVKKKETPVYGPKNKPVEKKADKKVEEKKVVNHGVTDDMSFSKAFRAARNSHGGSGGTFTWKGKKYNTNLKKSEDKKEEKKEDKKSAQDLIDEAKKKKAPKTKEDHAKQGDTHYYRNAPVGYEVLRGPKYKKGGYKRRGGRR